jgi:preprotein translocase subunit YajC
VGRWLTSHAGLQSLVPDSDDRHLLAASDQTRGSRFTMQLIIIPAMFVLMYVLLLRPQRKRQTEATQLRNRVGVGDEILTTSGVYGIISAMDDEDIWLEVSEHTEIRMARGAILKITQSADADPDADDDPHVIELSETAESESEPEA